MNKYNDIIVDRKGTSPTSFMKTTKIIKEINPRFIYKITKNNLIKTNKLSSNFVFKKTDIIIPRYAEIYGQWKNNKLKYNKENILGQSSIFNSFYPFYKIPVDFTTQERLAFYGCYLYKNNSTIAFESDTCIPLTSMNIGKKYFSNYIMNKNLGNGFYLEYHDRPHYHQPLDINSRGFIILAKKFSEVIYLVTAFKIPFGYSLYIPPYVLHNDCCLIGKYNVIYSKTKKYSTANFHHNNQLVKFRISKF